MILNRQRWYGTRVHRRNARGIRIRSADTTGQRRRPRRHIIRLFKRHIFNQVGQRELRRLLTQVKQEREDVSMLDFLRLILANVITIDHRAIRAFVRHDERVLRGVIIDLTMHPAELVQVHAIDLAFKGLDVHVSF